MRKVMYLAIDVDDKNFHGFGISNGPRKDIVTTRFRISPNVGALTKKINQLTQEGFQVKTCYEASYIGFSLYRDLKEKNLFCDIIAPSSIPRATGHTSKTDRIDAKKLAEYYKNELVTTIEVPSIEIEKARMLCRSRHFLARQVRDLKRRIVSTCRTVGLNYRGDSKFKSPAYFTKNHLIWLRDKIKDDKYSFVAESMEMMLSQLNLLEIQVKDFDGKIEEYASTPSFEKKVKALNCYRGLDTLSSMTLVAEIGDVNRFSHPSKLTSYVGLDLREYSSGGKEKKFNISKMGNSRMRYVVIEACQRCNRIPSVSTRLQNRRKKTEAKYSEVADRCMKRLHKKSSKLIARGKPTNKVKVACARELLGFVWESLRLAS